ncbi:Hypothetical protein CINCED_3A008311 [Cinara cedri]|uniref:Transposase, type 1 n=1 Tax=Cinara cedri TaxID=506608 RepID=A0A5E4MGP2_9HEMI|nr:Hypothetical protein CINCED_3A008311 [Cinara cedri]
MTKVCAKLVPKNLTPDQKFLRQQVCSDFLEKLKEDPGLMKNIITCDKTWIFQYDVKQSDNRCIGRHLNSPRIKKARISKSKFKAMLIDQIYYLSILATLRERVRKKRPELWKNSSWILHQDNAPAHNPLSV